MLTFGMPSHIDLSVTDVEASATWYADVFKLKRLKRVDLATRSVVMLIHPETKLIFGLNQHSAIPVPVFDDRSVGLDHFGFAVEKREDLDAWQAHLAQLNVVHSPPQDTENGAALVFRDPDNIQLEFWWPRIN